MRLVASSNVETISGKIDSYTGYFLRVKRSKSGRRTIFTCRRRGYVPADGHWRFILMCAEMAHTGLYVSDIIVDGKELYYALYEARQRLAAQSVKKYMIYNFHHIINLKITFGL